MGQSASTSGYPRAMGGNTGYQGKYWGALAEQDNSADFVGLDDLF